MNWDVWDYIAAATLLGGAALSVLAASRLIQHQALRRLAMLAGPLLFILIWIQLAVGLVP